MRPLNLGRDRAKAWERRPCLRADGGDFLSSFEAAVKRSFCDEPEVLAHLQQLLEVITLDELSHIGQRRNYLGAIAIRVARSSCRR